MNKPIVNHYNADEISVPEEPPAPPWGIETQIDLHDCDPELIRDAEAIKQYVIDLCNLIEMKRFGECIVVNFGEDERVAGYSMVQLIETSCISAHFANATNRVYMNIFSCKKYDVQAAVDFTASFFKAKKIAQAKVTNRD